MMLRCHYYAPTLMLTLFVDADVYARRQMPLARAHCVAATFSLLIICRHIDVFSLFRCHLLLRYFSATLPLILLLLAAAISPLRC